MDSNSLPVIFSIRRLFEEQSKSNRFCALGALSFKDSRIFNSELSKASEELSKPKRDIYRSVNRSEQITPILEEEKNFEIFKLPPLSKEEALEILKFYKQVGLIYKGKIVEYSYF